MLLADVFIFIILLSEWVQTDWGAKLKQKEEKVCARLLADIQQQVHQISGSSHANINNPAMVNQLSQNLEQLLEAHKRVLEEAVKSWLPVLLRCETTIEEQEQDLDDFARTFGGAMSNAEAANGLADMKIGKIADEKDQLLLQLEAFSSSLWTELNNRKALVISFMEKRAYQDYEAEKERLKNWLGGKIDELLPQIQAAWSRSYYMLPPYLKTLSECLTEYQKLSNPLISPR